MIYVAKRDLARLLQENLHLSNQVTELQAVGTQLVLEMRKLAKHEFDLPVKVIQHPMLPGEEPLELPKYHTEGSVGLDLHTAIAATLPAGGRRRLPTGLSIQLPAGYTAKVLPRSGISDKDGIVAVTSVIDWDYRGEISILVHNTSHDGRNIARGTRIAQLVIMPITRARLVEVEALEPTTRGEQGFGSTGE
jgi:dUTP pyrophosphatase